MVKRRGRGRLLVALLFAGVLASATYAFTATNTVPGSNAGLGSNTISGYTATNVDYTLNATDPTLLDAVDFDISPTTTSAVKIRLAPAGAWYDCVNTAGAVTCDTTSPAATVLGATELTVVAVD
jgi:hypothetical protein